MRLEGQDGNVYQAVGGFDLPPGTDDDTVNDTILPR